MTGVQICAIFPAERTAGFSGASRCGMYAAHTGMVALRTAATAQIDDPDPRAEKIVQSDRRQDQQNRRGRLDDLKTPQIRSHPV